MSHAHIKLLGFTWVRSAAFPTHHRYTYTLSREIERTPDAWLQSERVWCICAWRPACVLSWPCLL